MYTAIIHGIFLQACKHVISNVEVHGTTVGDESVALHEEMPRVRIRQWW